MSSNPHRASSRRRPGTSSGRCTASRAWAWSTPNRSSASVGRLSPQAPSAMRAGDIAFSERYSVQAAKQQPLQGAYLVVVDYL